MGEGRPPEPSRQFTEPGEGFLGELKHSVSPLVACIVPAPRCGNEVLPPETLTGDFREALRQELNSPDFVHVGCHV